jgi:diacylglycerol kinase
MLSSFKNAFRGIYLLLKTERNFQIHTLAFILVVSAGIYFKIPSREWINLLLISALVLGLEGLNTAVEKLSNEVTRERKASIRNLKDISAGAVLIAALFAVAVAVFTFGPYLVSV